MEDEEEVENGGRAGTLVTGSTRATRLAVGDSVRGIASEDVSDLSESTAVLCVVESVADLGAVNESPESNLPGVGSRSSSSFVVVVVPSLFCCSSLSLSRSLLLALC